MCENEFKIAIEKLAQNFAKFAESVSAVQAEVKEIRHEVIKNGIKLSKLDTIEEKVDRLIHHTENLAIDNKIFVRDIHENKREIERIKQSLS